MNHFKRLAFVIALHLCIYANGQSTNKLLKSSHIVTGAERMEVYLPFLKGKTVAIFANQTSLVNNTQLVDTLLKRGIKVIKIFANGG